MERFFFSLSLYIYIDNTSSYVYCIVYRIFYYKHIEKRTFVQLLSEQVTVFLHISLLNKICKIGNSQWILILNLLKVFVFFLFQRRIELRFYIFYTSHLCKLYFIYQKDWNGVSLNIAATATVKPEPYLFKNQNSYSSGVITLKYLKV